ncbi:MAG: SLC45 family MFS transporter [Clostridiales bacterium]|jgi:Na+/melibiose symporter-like transporter|nr:MFS transporter [Bacillota bacterium]NLK04281.1 SLC45 family MFS transporter [Clostridiales bacterium]
MKLNYKQTFFVGLAFMSITAFWEIYEGIIPKMLEGTFGLKETAVGAIMAIDNVLALFLLPILGALSDKVRTRMGRRMPFILAGTLLASVFTLILPIAEQRGKFVLFMVALGIVLLAMASYRSPAVALMPDVTPKPLRSKANAIINLMGTVGGTYALVMTLWLYTDDGSSNLPVFISVISLMIISVILLLLTVNENKLADKIKAEEDLFDIGVNKDIEDSRGNKKEMPAEVKRSLGFIMASIFLWFFAYNAVKTVFSRYADKVWGYSDGTYTFPLMVAMGAALIAYIPIGIISSKIGRKKTIMGGIILMTLSYLSGLLIKGPSPYINLMFACTGIGWAAISVNSYPMVVEMCKSADTGKYTGYYYTFSMTAQIITPIVSGFLLEKVGYWTLFPYAVVFSIASLCTMMFVKHGDSKPERRTENRIDSVE